MARAGFVLNLLLLALITIVSYLLVERVLG
jgi:hypothetical protein